MFRPFLNSTLKRRLSIAKLTILTLNFCRSDNNQKTSSCNSNYIKKPI